MESMRNIILTIVFAVLLGLSIGAASATLRARHATPIGGAKVEVDVDAFDFGEMDSSKDGSHDFTFTNKGDSPLQLTRGNTTCRCTVGEIADSSVLPGQSTTVKITWKSKHYAGPFKQSVTINTNDPNRREVILTISGDYTEPVHFEADELNFGQIVGDEPVTREVRIFSKLSNLSQRILGHKLTGLDDGEVFSGRYPALVGGRNEERPRYDQRRRSQSYCQTGLASGDLWTDNPHANQHRGDAGAPLAAVGIDGQGCFHRRQRLGRRDLACCGSARSKPERRSSGSCKSSPAASAPRMSAITWFTSSPTSSK